MTKGLELSNRVLVADASREMGFLLAVAKDDSVRNGRKALGLAEQATALATEVGTESLWNYKDALAAALAENGKFDDAVRVATQAAAEARGQKPYPPPPYVLDGLDTRVKSYQTRQAWRE